MRRFNAILSALILVLFLFHGVIGAFQIIGLSGPVTKVLAWSMLAMIAVHVIIGIKTTADSILVWKKTGAGYFRENALFWTRRLSGLLIMILIAFHLTAFSYQDGDVLRLQWFTAGRLITQLLLVASVAVHVISNVKPVLIAFGVKSLRERAPDILLALTILLLLMAGAFIYYYIRWNVM